MSLLKELRIVRNPLSVPGNSSAVIPFNSIPFRWPINLTQIHESTLLFVSSKENIILLLEQHTPRGLPATMAVSSNPQSDVKRRNVLRPCLVPIRRILISVQLLRGNTLTHNSQRVFTLPVKTME